MSVCCGGGNEQKGDYPRRELIMHRDTSYQCWAQNEKISQWMTKTTRRSWMCDWSSFQMIREISKTKNQCPIENEASECEWMNEKQMNNYPWEEKRNRSERQMWATQQVWITMKHRDWDERESWNDNRWWNSDVISYEAIRERDREVHAFVNSITVTTYR